MAISIFGTKANNTDIVVKDTVTGDVDLSSGDLTTTGTVTGNLFSGSGASLTALQSAQLTGALPAIDGSALTGVSPIAASDLPSASATTDGYVKFSGGYTMQWGRVTGTGTATITVTYPIAFTYFYSVCITGADNGTGAQGTTGNLISDNTQTTTSQFQFKTGGNIETQYWIATGFIS